MIANGWFLANNYKECGLYTLTTLGSNFLVAFHQNVFVSLKIMLIIVFI